MLIVYVFFFFVHAAAALSFGPHTVNVNDSSASIVVSGVGLQSVTSVRDVRFEPSGNCTVSVVGATNGTVSAVGGMSNNGGDLSRLAVVVGGSGLAAGVYSVCVDFSGNDAGGQYQRVDSSGLFVGEFFVFVE